MYDHLRYDEPQHQTCEYCGVVKTGAVKSSFRETHPPWSLSGFLLVVEQCCGIPESGNGGHSQLAGRQLPKPDDDEQKEGEILEIEPARGQPADFAIEHAELAPHAFGKAL